MLLPKTFNFGCQSYKKNAIWQSEDYSFNKFGPDINTYMYQIDKEKKQSLKSALYINLADYFNHVIKSVK